MNAEGNSGGSFSYRPSTEPLPLKYGDIFGMLIDGNSVRLFKNGIQIKINRM